MFDEEVLLLDGNGSDGGIAPNGVITAPIISGAKLLKCVAEWISTPFTAEECS